MEITEYIASLSEEGRLLAAAAEQAGPGASVPTCPGWQIRHLLRHTGMVHRWAAELITARHTTPHPDGGEPDLDGDELLDWFRAGHRHLVRSLEAAPADLECWTFMPAPSPLAFWSRRQLNETTVHRVDAESALGGPLTTVGADRAADGIDELLTGFHSRPKSRVRSSVPRTLRVRAVDTDAVWTVRISDAPPQTVRVAVPGGADGGDGGPGAEGGGDRVDCELSGTAEGLYLTLWNRLPLAAVTLRGDRSVARLWTDNSAVTW
ncbi:maleylpyruvate isomerase family mycothiol-dependent enzyme [Streptomyces microflavus]|uniref:Maleylpyruvate isomerase family mycothiol-dependent enzyme n=1 Tax=Streptomyces microflavus TaxID=1919 RepID=A0ABV1Q3W6_STRMI|nr:MULTISPECIES: maleylpyruvate isomerase family mycothiol-dependent enzyme [Streptomyces]MEE1733171.1 maleylpyruvate isomerase family mycothiol-dependent enzyme [Streptomyces sp. BE282]WSR89756.1 maleylpyruvate isomerase family mycothiol-dependent enzyme [Streptomyces microflavus]